MHKLKALAILYPKWYEENFCKSTTYLCRYIRAYIQLFFSDFLYNLFSLLYTRLDRYMSLWRFWIKLQLAKFALLIFHATLAYYKRCSSPFLNIFNNHNLRICILFCLVAFHIGTHDITFFSGTVLLRSYYIYLKNIRKYMDFFSIFKYEAHATYFSSYFFERWLKY